MIILQITLNAIVGGILFLIVLIGICFIAKKYTAMRKRMVAEQKDQVLEFFSKVDPKNHVEESDIDNFVRQAINFYPESFEEASVDCSNPKNFFILKEIKKVAMGIDHYIGTPSNVSGDPITIDIDQLDRLEKRKKNAMLEIKKWILEGFKN